MAWEWVSPAATGTVALGVGVTGIVATYKAVQAQIKGQVDLAREERKQRRLEVAYTELQLEISETYQWARSVHPMYQQGTEEYAVPPLPPSSAQRQAVILSAWSPRVQQLMETWRQAVNNVVGAGVKLEAALTAERTGWTSELTVPDARQAIWTRIEELYRIDLSIIEQVWSELQGEHHGHVEPTGALDQASPRPVEP
jgi:hypothetical protein